MLFALPAIATAPDGGATLTPANGDVDTVFSVFVTDLDFSYGPSTDSFQVGIPLEPDDLGQTDWNAMRGTSNCIPTSYLDGDGKYTGVFWVTMNSETPVGYTSTTIWVKNWQDENCSVYANPIFPFNTGSVPDDVSYYPFVVGTSTVEGIEGTWDLDVSWQLDEGFSSASSVFTDHLSEMFGAATSVFPMCVTDPFLTLLGTFVGLLDGDVHPQILRFSWNGNNYDLNSTNIAFTDDPFFQQIKEMVWEFMAAIVYSAIGLYFFLDMLKVRSTAADDEN